MREGDKSKVEATADSWPATYHGICTHCGKTACVKAQIAPAPIATLCVCGYYLAIHRTMHKTLETK